MRKVEQPTNQKVPRPRRIPTKTLHMGVKSRLHTHPQRGLTLILASRILHLGRTSPTRTQALETQTRIRALENQVPILVSPAQAQKKVTRKVPPANTLAKTDILANIQQIGTVHQGKGIVIRTTRKIHLQGGITP